METLREVSPSNLKRPGLYVTSLHKVLWIRFSSI